MVKIGGRWSKQVVGGQKQVVVQNGRSMAIIVVVQVLVMWRCRCHHGPGGSDMVRMW